MAQYLVRNYKLLPFNKRNKPCRVCNTKKSVKYEASVDTDIGIVLMRFCNRCIITHCKIDTRQ